jgi:hypothetical protein
MTGEVPTVTPGIEHIETGPHSSNKRVMPLRLRRIILIRRSERHEAVSGGEALGLRPGGPTFGIPAMRLVAVDQRDAMRTRARLADDERSLGWVTRNAIAGFRLHQHVLEAKHAVASGPTPKHPGNPVRRVRRQPPQPGNLAPLVNLCGRHSDDATAPGRRRSPRDCADHTPLGLARDARRKTVVRMSRGPAWRTYRRSPRSIPNRPTHWRSGDCKGTGSRRQIERSQVRPSRSVSGAPRRAQTACLYLGRSGSTCDCAASSSHSSTVESSGSPRSSRSRARRWLRYTRSAAPWSPRVA